MDLKRLNMNNMIMRTFQVRTNFLRGHAKTGPFLPPSKLIARNEDIDQAEQDTLDGRSEMGSEYKGNLSPFICDTK